MGRQGGGVCAALLILLLGCLAAGCSSIAPFQGETIARVRVGNHDAVEREARAVAPLVVSYGLLALQAYRNELYRLGQRTGRLPEPQADSTPEFTRLARPWLRPWRLVDALVNECGEDWGNRRDFGYGPVRGSCESDESPAGRILDGLGVQIWARDAANGAYCPEIVIAFRGTDRRQADDWLSNFRAVTRVLHLYDQYEQVQAHIGGILQRVTRLPCYREGRTRITATGHSLGGGLAQQAAYQDKRVRRVYAFDPSFVTGYYDLAPELRQDNERGLRIERVYEHGEVLAYPRLVLRNLYPPSPCNPQIRNIRFNLQHGGTIISQHSLPGLLQRLMEISKRPRAGPVDESVLPVSELTDPVSHACRPISHAVLVGAAPAPRGE